MRTEEQIKNKKEYFEERVRKPEVMYNMHTDLEDLQKMRHFIQALEWVLK